MTGGGGTETVTISSRVPIKYTQSIQMEPAHSIRAPGPALSSLVRVTRAIFAIQDHWLLPELRPTTLVHCAGGET